MFGECGPYESTGASPPRQPTQDESCLLGHWYDIRGNVGIPSWADLDPTAPGPIHSRLMLVEVLGDDAMIRIAGLEIERTVGRLLQRVRCSHLFRPETCPRLHAEFAAGIGITCPQWPFGSLAEIRRDWVSYRRLTVPFLSERDDAAWYLLSLFTFSLPKVVPQPVRSISAAAGR